MLTLKKQGGKAVEHQQPRNSFAQHLPPTLSKSLAHHTWLFFVNLCVNEVNLMISSLMEIIFVSHLFLSSIQICGMSQNVSDVICDCCLKDGVIVIALTITVDLSFQTLGRL